MKLYAFAVALLSAGLAALIVFLAIRGLLIAT